MITRELYDGICKIVREKPELDKFKVNNKLGVIRMIEGDEANEKERDALRETHLSQGIIDVDDKEFELFLL